MNSIKKIVQQFYNTTPFPDYELERFQTKQDLILSASPFAKILDRSIPADASIIDVGTGTGQLSAFLSLRRKEVYGIDFSDSSLNKAMALKHKLNLDTWHLKKVDIFDETQINQLGTFDYVLCLGVLHHTENPYLGFQRIVSLMKPGGYIAIGLYNRFGRIPLQVRKFLVHTLFLHNEKVKEKFISLQIDPSIDLERRRGWWNDQYEHPHETTHTQGEVLQWFKNNNIQYYQSVPSMKPFGEDILEIIGVWNNNMQPYPHLLTRIYKQIKWISETHHEGGYWITFGRKNE